MDRDEYRKLYYQTNREIIIARSKEYYVANRDECIAKSREYYLANRDKNIIRNNKYVTKNKALIKIWQKQYYIDNRAYLLAKQKTYNLERKEHYKKYMASKGVEHLSKADPVSNLGKVAAKTASIKANLAILLIKKEAFIKKLAEENI